MLESEQFEMSSNHSSFWISNHSSFELMETFSNGVAIRWAFDFRPFDGHSWIKTKYSEKF